MTSASAFALRGVKLVFADSEKGSPNVSVDCILKSVSAKTKAIVVVHYAGVAVDVNKILEGTNNQIPLVEDCAHAICSIDPNSGEYVGKAGSIATFSFHETKNVGIGEGGLIVVNDEKLWERAQVIREKGTNRTDFKAGKAAFYTWVDLGSSFLMSEVDAAILFSALENMDTIQDARLNTWDIYDSSIVAHADVFKKPSSKLRANAHMYFLEFHSTKVRAEFCNYMKKQNILVATHYLPLDTSPYIQKVQPPTSECDQAAAWSKSLVRLPLFLGLTSHELNRIVSAVNGFSVNKAGN